MKQTGHCAYVNAALGGCSLGKGSGLSSGALQWRLVLLVTASSGTGDLLLWRMPSRWLLPGAFLCLCPLSLGTQRLAHYLPLPPEAHCPFFITGVQDMPDTRGHLGHLCMPVVGGDASHVAESGWPWGCRNQEALGQLCPSGHRGWHLTRSGYCQGPKYKEQSMQAAELHCSHQLRSDCVTAMAWGCCLQGPQTEGIAARQVGGNEPFLCVQQA